jgi:hypothetical protein
VSRPLSWLSRWSTSEVVCSEQENAYHGDSRSGVPRVGHCATAVPSLGHQVGAMRAPAFILSLAALIWAPHPPWRGLCFAPSLRDSGLSVTMPGGGTRLGEEVRDGPHSDNRGGGDRSGVAPAAAPLRSQPSLYTVLGRAFLDTPPRRRGLRSAPPRCPKPAPLCGCVRVHQHIIPDDMSIPRRRSWPYRGGAMLNFAIKEFCELRLLGILGSSLTAWLRNVCRNAQETVLL